MSQTFIHFNHTLVELLLLVLVIHEERIEAELHDLLLVSRLGSGSSLHLLQELTTLAVVVFVQIRLLNVLQEHVRQNS
jgi:hypothetical protein